MQDAKQGSDYCWCYHDERNRIVSHHPGCPFHGRAQSTMPSVTCGCGCCADGVNRALTGRRAEDGCTCHLYGADERCNCPFCANVLAVK